MSLDCIDEAPRDAEAGPRFTLAEGSSEPIYQQLASQLRRHVASGSLAPGDEVPSVRRLASDLGVSKMTVSKAFHLLESQGCLHRRRGRCLVVSDAPRQVNAPALELLRPTLERAAQEAFELGLTIDQAIELFGKVLCDPGSDSRAGFL